MKRFLALILALLTLFCSCAREMPQIVTTAEPTETTEPLTSTFILDSRYKILRSDTSEDAVEAAQYIRQAVEDISGERLNFETDWVRRDEPIVPGEFEILVGATNRKESAELFASFKRGDWEYRVNEGQIIICGGGAESTLEAAVAFCKDILGYDGQKPDQTSIIELTSGASRSFKQTYPITAVTLNGKPITDYVLAVPKINSGSLALTDLFNDLLSENAGFQLSVKAFDDLEPGELYIEIGQKKNELPIFQYSVSDSNGILKFAGDSNSLSDAIIAYLSQELSADSGTIELSLPKEPIIGYGGQHNYLILKNETKEKIADGVEYRHLSYQDKDGKPVNAYVLVVEPGKAEVINGTPGGGTAIYNVSATTVDAANAAEKQGYRVLAGVNADFFRINSDYSPQGLCIKNGEILSSDTNYPYFGVTNEGKFVIADSSTISVNAANLKEAVGGRNIILRNGAIYQVAYGEEFGYTRHPRTAVGYDSEGRLYLLVVDGRQPALSNGASLTDLAIMMLDLGATDALNLDGGGSSTFILENGAGFKTMNSPSDGSLRKVYNSLLIVVK